MFRNTLILTLLLPLLLCAQINTGGGSYEDPAGNTLTYKPWPQPFPPTINPNVLPGAMWIVSFAINDLAATVGRAFTDLQNHEQAINKFDIRVKGLEASLSVISANAKKTGSGGGILQVKDWPLSAVLAKGSIDTDHGITVKTVDTTGNITSSDGYVTANFVTAREGLTAEWLFTDGGVKCGTLESFGGIAAGGKITGVSEPSNPSDAATKNYADTTFALASTNTLVVYTITGVTATGFTLSPIRLVGVTGTAATGSPSFEFVEQDVVSAVTSDTSKLSQSSRKALIHVTSPSVSTEIIEFVDHGSFGN